MNTEKWDVSAEGEGQKVGVGVEPEGSTTQQSYSVLVLHKLEVLSKETAPNPKYSMDVQKKKKHN